jgi:hypothetical protein|tara:strand:+ start:961 stop:1341 length:381 start_codon:yes stop_codon:yes gene_type:complete
MTPMLIGLVAVVALTVIGVLLVRTYEDLLGMQYGHSKELKRSLVNVVSRRLERDYQLHQELSGSGNGSEKILTELEKEILLSELLLDKLRCPEQSSMMTEEWWMIARKAGEEGAETPSFTDLFPSH